MCMTNKHSQQHYQEKLKNIDEVKYEKYLAKKREERFNLAKTILRSRIDSFIQKSNLDKQIVKRVENINSGYIITENSIIIEELLKNINSGNASKNIFESLSLIFSEYMCSRFIHRSLEIENKNIIKNESDFKNKCKYFIIFNDQDFHWGMNVYRLFERERICQNPLNESNTSFKSLRCSIDGFSGIGFSDNSFIIEYDDELIPHDDKNVIKFLNNKLSIIIRHKFENPFNSKFELKMPFDIKVKNEIFFLKENE